MNEYHRQFLAEFGRRDVRFIVIGGRARQRIDPAHKTRDLDIWVDPSPSNHVALEKSLVAWKRRYPSHTLQNFSPPLPLRPGVQIKLPDDHCLYLTDKAEVANISPSDGIDVLTSIAQNDFAEFFARAVRQEIDGFEVPFLAELDLDVVSPSKV